LNNDDINKIKSAYEKHPPFKVKTTTPAVVEGVATTKMELDPASSKEATAFTNDLNSVSIVQNVRKCLKDSGVNDQVDKAIKAPTSTADNGTTQYFAYVTPGKQLKRLEIVGGDKDTTGNIAFTFENQTPSIVAPTGAKPIQDLAGALFAGALASGATNQPQ